MVETLIFPLKILFIYIDNSLAMGKIDISTEEKKKEIFEIFNTLKNKSQVHKYFNISDNTQGIKYINEIADAIGFDLNVYQQR